jgi:uncharacterized tellurite resistance protein B-like protein
MFAALLRTLGFDADEATSSAEAEPLQAIAATLAQLPAEEARYVAAFAYLLSRVAHADHDLSDLERRSMEDIIVHRAGLPAEQATLVVNLATSQTMRVRGTEDYLVSREFARLATPAQKTALIDCLFAVSASDSHIITAEDNEIRRIASEIQFEHAEFVAIRGRYRAHLAVLKDSRE